MGVTVLASHESQVHAGYLAAMFGIPLIGLICLTIGLWDRSRSRRQPRPGYPYPPAHFSQPALHPGQYPARPFPGYPPHLPPRPRTGKSATTLIVIGSVVLTFGGLGILGNIARVLKEEGNRSHKTSHAQPDGTATGPQMGQCFAEFDLRLEFHNRSAIDCADPTATYQLVAQAGPTATCPDGQREDSLYEVFTNESSTLCFAANLKQGQCYMKMDDGKSKRLTPADCDDRRFAQIKVVRRIDGSSDKSQCPADTKGVSYPVPPRVYCFVAAGP